MQEYHLSFYHHIGIAFANSKVQLINILQIAKRINMYNFLKIIMVLITMMILL